MESAVELAQAPSYEVQRDPRDPREEPRWFSSLPVRLQLEFRAEWEAELVRRVQEPADQQRPNRKRAFWSVPAESVALFLCVDLFVGLCSGMGWGCLPGDLLGGALVGLLWLLTRAQELMRPVLAGSTYFVLQWLWLAQGRGSLLALFFGTLLISVGAAWLGNSIRRQIGS